MSKEKLRCYWALFEKDQRGKINCNLSNHTFNNGLWVQILSVCSINEYTNKLGFKYVVRDDNGNIGMVYNADFISDVEEYRKEIE